MVKNMSSKRSLKKDDDAHPQDTANDTQISADVNVETPSMPTSTVAAATVAAPTSEAPTAAASAAKEGSDVDCAEEEVEAGDVEEEDEVDKNRFKLDDGTIIDYSATPDEAGIIATNAAFEEMFYVRRAEELEAIQQEEEKIRTEKGIPIEQFRATFEDNKINGKKYHLITWEQLKRVHCYERPAHGFMIAGDISQKHTQHWDRSKQIKVRDHEGKVEGAVFFYDENSPQPHFEWEKVEVGNYIEIKSPRLHKFMDGQDGLRIEENAQIGTIRKRTFTEAKKFEYGTLNKENGNTKYLRALKMLQEIAEEEEEKKREKLLKGGKKKGSEAVPNAAFRSLSAGNRMLDDAIVSYEMAISHLECTFTSFSPDQRAEARKALASCYLNVAACQIAQKKWDCVEMPCDKALSINASKQLNAKAYYRIAQAMLELGSPRRMAEEKLKRAQTILLPESDSAINGLLHKIAVMDYEEKQQEKLMFRNRREAAEQKKAAVTTASSASPAVPPALTQSAGKETIEGEPLAAPASSQQEPSPFSPNVPSTQSFGLKRSLFGPPPSGLYGAPNFRDLGGLPTGDGKRVTRRFILYRSNTLCLATSSAALEGALSEFPDASEPNYASKEAASAEEDAKMQHLKRDLAFVPLRDVIRRQDVASYLDNEDDANDGENASEALGKADAERKKSTKQTWTFEPFNDLKTLVDDFGIKSIIDFRNEHEARAQAKKMKKLRGGAKTGKWFVDYQELFTTIKVICSADNQQPPSSTTSDDGSAAEKGASSRPAVVDNFFRRVFLLVAGGGLQPTPLLDPSATRKRKVWLTLKQKRTKVFQNGVLIPAPKTSAPMPSAGVEKWSANDIALQDALVNHPVVFRVDLVTRSLISLSSYLLLLTLALCALFAQIRLASSIMVRFVVNKQTQKDLFINILTYQGPEIAHVFSILSDPKSYPVVLSCSMGKDRTGLITALVLAACEVKFDAIVKDFADRTNECLPAAPFLMEEQRALGLNPKEWDVAKGQTLKEVFLFLKTEYGGILSYLRTIGVTDEQITRIRNLVTRPVS